MELLTLGFPFSTLLIMSNECIYFFFLFLFYLDSFSSPGKSPLDKSPTQGRQAAFGSPAWSRLRSSCLVVRVDDLDIHQVGTQADSGGLG